METYAKKQLLPFNKVLYAMFILLATYQVFNHNYIDSAATLGIGLAFDPFKAEQPWHERPRWQKIWLLVHLALVALLFGLGVGIADR